MWFRVGSLALPQKTNLHSHIFRNALYSTSPRGVFHVLQDVILVSVPWLHPCLPRGIFEVPRLNRPCNVKAGDHIHIGQGWRHWAVTKQEGVDAV
jgi:quercetin dioxygenase-like cupin family protein